MKIRQLQKCSCLIFMCAILVYFSVFQLPG